MSINDTLALANVTITAIGVCFVILAFVEYNKVKKLKKELETLKNELNRENSLIQNATQKIIASYAVSDIDQKISLLELAVSIYPKIYNGYNSLGYAFLDKGEKFKAINAFKQAIDNNHEDKAGYFDIAHAYLQLGETDLCIEYLEQAVEVDKSSIDDIKDDVLLVPMSNNKKLQKLLSRYS